MPKLEVSVNAAVVYRQIDNSDPALPCWSTVVYICGNKATAKVCAEMIARVKEPNETVEIAERIVVY